MWALKEGVDLVFSKPYVSSVCTTIGFVLGIAVVASVVNLHSIAHEFYFGWECVCNVSLYQGFKLECVLCLSRCQSYKG